MNDENFVDLSVGYLLEKKDITYEGKKVEVFCLVDYVVGCIFENRDYGKRCVVLSGNYTSINASYLAKNATPNDKYYFFESNLSRDIKENDMKVDFEKIRKKKIDGTYKYYTIKDPKDGLKAIKDEKLISILNNDNKKDFSEDEFENSTDISSMYSEIKKNNNLSR